MNDCIKSDSFPKIVVTAFGDPFSPGTWSGVPKAICDEIREQGMLAGGIDVSKIENPYLRKATQRFVRICNNVSYGTMNHSDRMFPRRQISALICQRQLNRFSQANAILHTGSIWLPLSQKVKCKQYMYFDTTWHLRYEHCIDRKMFPDSVFRYADKLEKKALQQMDHLFLMADFPKEDLIKHYDINPKRISNVRAGRGKIVPYSGKKNYQNGITMFVAKGGFEEKGGLLLMNAFKIAQQRNPKLKLIVVNRDPQSEMCNKVPGCIRHGFVSWDKLQELFEEASLFAMPALDEALGLVYLEAMSCRVPVLGLARNSLQEITGNGKYGFLAKQEDPAEIAQLLLLAHSDPVRLQEMGSGAQKYVLQRYSWKNTVNKIIALMNNTQRQAI